MPHLIAPSITTQLRRIAIAVSIASALMLGASLATRLRPAGVAPRHVGDVIDWNGWIGGAPEGTYTFAVPSGGVTQLAIDGRIVSNGAIAAPIHLDPSPHAFDFQDRRASPRASGGWCASRCSGSSNCSALMP